jgi:hypothetical protein
MPQEIRGPGDYCWRSSSRDGRAIWGAAKTIDYEWRWYRVPQYFFYEAEDLKKAPFDGLVSAVEKKGNTTAVTLTSETGEKIILEVDSDPSRLRPRMNCSSATPSGSRTAGRWAR